MSECQTCGHDLIYGETDCPACDAVQEREETELKADGLIHGIADALEGEGNQHGNRQKR